MSKKVSTIPFAGTPEQEAQLKKVIAELKDLPGALMPILQKAQDIYGYLPIEVQRMVADGLSVSMAKVYGVVTFYSQFSLSPKGKYQVSICMGTACYVRGAGDILDRFADRLNIKSGECTLDGTFSLEACRCIGACGLAPVILINEKVYGNISVDDVDGILAEWNYEDWKAGIGQA